MKINHWNHHIKKPLVLVFLFVGMLILNSCVDDYYYDDREPEWLGASIYDYLKDQGNYTNYVKLIEDTEYTEILAKTGSKTLFAANDEAFERFFQNNDWGVSSYDQLSLTQKKLILKYGMLDNAYLIETLANYNNGTLQLGTAIRRATSMSQFDSIRFEIGEQLPETSFWNYYRDKGIYMIDYSLLSNTGAFPLVHFLQKSLENAGISDTDFELITGQTREPGDAHIFKNKVIERDITCKNGYIHILSEVLIPPTNVAQYLKESDNNKTFSKLLERFNAPYYDEDINIEYREIHPEFTDSLFLKGYFSETGGPSAYPNGKRINSELLLPLNPGWNNYINTQDLTTFGLQSDMAAVLAPTDQAMDDYFNAGSGLVLKQRYGSWENIPDDIIALFMKRHLRASFIQTVPSRFDKMKDSENSPIPVQGSDIESTYVGVNGLVYKTNAVYPPDDYVSVYGPVLFSENARIFNWAIWQNDFRLYLNSLVSTYSFFVPVDSFFDSYIDPVAYSKDVPAILRFWYNDEEETVVATAYSYNVETYEVGDSIGYIEDEDFISNRLLDLLDQHIVVNGVESGDNFFFTKGGNILTVEGSGIDLTVQGGGDKLMGTESKTTNFYNQQNGKTYFIDKPIQTPLQSVYKVLSQNEEFNEFFKLLSGFDPSSNNSIFIRRANNSGIDFNIKFFNTFNYTVYVPTNEAILQAISDGIIPSWDEINAVTEESIYNEMVDKLERFLRYHFQDNSVLVGGDADYKLYQTATIKEVEDQSRFGTYKDKYYRLGVTTDGSNLSITTEAMEDYGVDAASVVTTPGLYNILTRDYIFNDLPSNFAEIDESGSGAQFSNSTIFTSSTAVIHQIDNILRFE